MPAWVPPFKRPGYVASAVAPEKPALGPGRVRFPKTAANATNATVNHVILTVRHSPRNVAPTKSALRLTRRVSPAGSPPQRPATRHANLAPKFRSMLDAAGKPLYSPETRKSKRKTRKTAVKHHKPSKKAKKTK
jgi:hypothetical protein